MICRKLQLQPGDRFLDIGCGIGENSTNVRQISCQGQERLGIHLDAGKNEDENEIFEIHSDDSKVNILIIATDEEREIAAQPLQVIQKIPTSA